MKKKLAVYLAGGMENASNMGANWRKEITPFLESLGLEVLDPSVFEPEQLKGLQPKQLPEFYTNFEGRKVKPKHWHELKNAREPRLYNRFLMYMRRIIKYDIELVQRDVDYVIVLWDEAASRGAGTHSELTIAYLKNIPVYCIAYQDMPGWAKGCCTHIFLTFDALKAFLKEEFDGE